MATLSFSSVQFSRSVLSESLRPHEPRHARPPCPSPTPGIHPNPCPSSRWCHPLPSPLLLPPVPPSSRVFPTVSVLCVRWPNTGGSASASVLPVNIQDWFPLGWTGWILQSRDSQESFLTPQFKNINSSVLSFLYNPTLTSIHDYWKNHSLD